MISIKNTDILRKFEDDFIRNNNMTVEEKFRLMDDLYNFAYSLNKLTIDDTDNLDALIKTLKVFRDADKAAYKGS